ncbi:MAG: Eco57I restriction-modification methylase domain-containing protein [Gemmatimonas sp.]
MLTIRAATSLLAQAHSLDALNNLAHKLGFDTPMLHVTPEALASLGIGEWVSNARLTRATSASADDNRRLLAVHVCHQTADARELTRRICHALVRHAPTRLWNVLLLDEPATTLFVATTHADQQHTRVAALRVDLRRIVDSDADTIRALAVAATDNDRLCHARWTDILRRDALSARFYRSLDEMVVGLASSARGKATREERHELALLCASRLLFLAFLEAKGWLAGERDFLLRHCTMALEQQHSLHTGLLKPLFFGTLNTPLNQRALAAKRFGNVPFLNGGLFSPTRLEQQRRTLVFDNDAIAAIVGDLLDRYRFTAREDSSTWSEAAVDPEMLGRAFECLMATDERRRSGSFYTPPTLVERTVLDALDATIPGLSALSALAGTVTARDRDSGTLPHADRLRIAGALQQLHILDPACGSGAFLVHTLEHIASLRQHAGDTRPLHTIRRETLTTSIFGVDRNPMAVWLCELRLWLSVVIECPETDPTRIPPLPNLDHNIRVGDSLNAGNLEFASPSARTLTRLRLRYANASGNRKRTLAASLDAEERKRAVAESTRMIAATTTRRGELLETLRRRDLFGQRTPPTRAQQARLLELRHALHAQRVTRNRLELGAALPFRFAAHFADVAANGFDLVIGNPPWVRPHNLPAAERTQLRSAYRTLRHAAWRAGALRAGAGAGFAAQADLAAAFVERSSELLKPHGTLALLLPAKLWRSLAGGGVRQLLAESMQIQTVRDFSDASALFDAAVYPSLLVATRNPTKNVDNDTSAKSNRIADAGIAVSIARGAHERVFHIPRAHLSMGADPAAPWLLLPPDSRNAFERLRRAGPALGDSHLGRPLLGVKCGLNSAFVVSVTEHDDDTATITHDGHTFVIERALLRPALKGEAITTESTRRTRRTQHDVRILWTHALDGTPLRSLPPRTARWFARFRPQLETRKDARTRQPWWTLFRTEAARTESARLVWADLGKQLRTTVLSPGDPTVPLNTCYVLRTNSLVDAHALNTLLTSPVAAAFLDAIAEPARGGYRRFLGWTVASLPVPANWETARVALSAFHKRLSLKQPPTAEEHLAIVAAAYGIPAASLLPLIHWRTR